MLRFAEAFLTLVVCAAYLALIISPVAIMRVGSRFEDKE